MDNNFEFKNKSSESDDVYSKSVRAGKRTYFFDVKSTKNEDFFLTITESRKKIKDDGEFFFEKHKIYLYKEDFAKFTEGLSDVVAYIKEHKPEFFDGSLESTVGTGSTESIDKLDSRYDGIGDGNDNVY